jgi:hypothetical protein
MSNMEWVLEGIESNESHKLLEKLPQRIWEMQFLIID